MRLLQLYHPRDHSWRSTYRRHRKDLGSSTTCRRTVLMKKTLLPPVAIDSSYMPCRLIPETIHVLHTEVLVFPSVHLYTHRQKAPSCVFFISAISLTQRCQGIDAPGPFRPLLERKKERDSKIIDRETPQERKPTLFLPPVRKLSTSRAPWKSSFPPYRRKVERNAQLREENRHAQTSRRASAWFSFSTCVYSEDETGGAGPYGC